MATVKGYAEVSGFYPKTVSHFWILSAIGLLFIDLQ